MENIQKAISRSSKHKKRRKVVKKILSNRDFYAEQIHEMLVNNKIEWGDDHYKIIIESSSKKERDITIPNYYPDQIIHWAIILVIEKYLRKGMCDCCIGSVPKRGPIVGMKTVRKWLEKDKKIKHIEKADVYHFFQSINVEKMKELLRRDFKDETLLGVLNYILDKGSRFTGKGLPIGYYTSQWLSNYYLESLDHEILEKGKPRHYIRYVDDIVIFESSKRKLRRIHELMEGKLAELSLRIKKNWQIFKKWTRALDFLGFRFYESYITLRKRIILHTARLVRKFAKQRKKHIRTCRAIVSLYGRFVHIDNGQAIYRNCFSDKAPIGYIKLIISKYDKAKKAASAII